jgi:hypothetical protein
MTNWRDLIVYEVIDGFVDRLGTLVDNKSNILNNIVIKNGFISEWRDYFIAMPGEIPDWKTPRGNIDWTGFEEAWNKIKGEF